MPGVHARLSPSAAVRWGNCPASVRHDDKVRVANGGEMPDKSGPAAELGTFAHKLAEHRILAAFATVGRKGEHERKAEAIIDDPFLLYGEDDVIKNSGVYSDFVINFVNDFRPADLDWNVEGKFELWYEPGSNGTADFWAVDKQQKRLYILDYKSGRIQVDSYQNPQLAIYAIAAYDFLKKFNEIEEIYCGVHQPLYSHSVEWWEFGLEELEHIRTQVDRSVREINNPMFSPRYEPSIKACQWCYHAGTCVARADALERDHPPNLELEELSSERLFEIHSNAKLHKDFLDAVEKRIREMSEDDRESYGWKLVRGSRRLKWKLGADVEKALANSGVDLYTKPVLKSPAAIRTEIGDDGQLLDQLGLIEETFNKPSLVPVSDKREPLGSTGAE